MKILVTGASGLVGSALTRALSAGGHDVVRLVRTRTPASPAEVSWDPESGMLDASRLAGIDAAIHLAGESIASGRWSESRKIRIRESRVRGTRLLADALARLPVPPRALISSSAMGYYGDRGDEILDETKPPGSGFLADVCREWEGATGPAAAEGVRVVNVRWGLILSRDGGALPRMLPPFRLGVGGRLGSGRQYMSWITLEDAVGVLLLALAADGLSGPVNAVAPGTVTNAEFTRALGRVLARPTLLAVPPFGVRLFFGEMGDALLLSSARLAPVRLLASGYAFREPEIEGALRRILA